MENSQEDSLEQRIQTVLSTLKCSICKKILSVPPIKVLSEDGSELQCGRCKDVPKKSLGRNYAFEKLAEALFFPCINEGCDELKPWSEVLNHEESCTEKSVRCPIDNKCNYIKVKKLEEHLVNEHTGNIFFNTLTRTCNTKQYVPSVLIFKNQIFFVLTGGSPNFDIYIAMLVKDINTSFTFNVKLSSVCNDACVSFEKQQINKYDERQHCLFCISKTCSLAYHPHSTVYSVDPVIKFKRISLETISTLFVNITQIKYYIEIVANDQHLRNSSEPIEDMLYAQTNNLRNNLLCPICIQYMIGYIFNCQNGHVVCHTCKPKLDTCPACRVSLGTLRCFPLENIAEVMVLNCVNTPMGCNVSGKVKLLYQHEKECEYIGDGS